MKLLTKETMEQLILDHISWVDKLANQKHNRHRWIDRDDLKSAAYEGLCQAANSYKTELGEFKTHAFPRVIGCMMDHIRSVSDFYNHHNNISRNELQRAEKPSIDADDLLNKLLAPLPENGQTMMKEFYLHDKSLLDIAKETGKTVSCVTSSLHNYRKALRERWHNEQELFNEVHVD